MPCWILALSGFEWILDTLELFGMSKRYMRDGGNMMCFILVSGALRLVMLAMFLYLREPRILITMPIALSICIVSTLAARSRGYVSLHSIKCSKNSEET